MKNRGVERERRHRNVSQRHRCIHNHNIQRQGERLKQRPAARTFVSLQRLEVDGNEDRKEEVLPQQAALVIIMIC